MILFWLFELPRLVALSEYSIQREDLHATAHCQ